MEEEHLRAAGFDDPKFCTTNGPNIDERSLGDSSITNLACQRCRELGADCDGILHACSPCGRAGLECLSDEAKSPSPATVA